MINSTLMLTYNSKNCSQLFQETQLTASQLTSFFDPNSQPHSGSVSIRKSYFCNVTANTGPAIHNLEQFDNKPRERMKHKVDRNEGANNLNFKANNSWEISSRIILILAVRRNFSRSYKGIITPIAQRNRWRSYAKSYTNADSCLTQHSSDSIFPLEIKENDN